MGRPGPVPKGRGRGRGWTARPGGAAATKDRIDQLASDVGMIR